MHACIHARMYVCMYVCMYVSMYVCMYVCTYACMHACMYVCMYVRAMILLLGHFPCLDYRVEQQTWFAQRLFRQKLGRRVDANRVWNAVLPTQFKVIEHLLPLPHLHNNDYSCR